jgi:serine/threonine protein kinase
MPEELGRYRIKKRLAAGGMGAVYLVENTELQREEALKIPYLDSGDAAVLRERFLREARAAAKMDHPNLCPIYDVGVIDGISFLTMRFLRGKPLSAYTGSPFPAREALDIVIKLAQALDHAHQKGVIHRDLKPSNVMMCPSSGPTVIDFGLAKQTTKRDQKLTETGAMLGTLAYMPPEQVRGQLDRLGPASDIYSLAVILVELLTGRVPFKGTQAEVMDMIIYSETPVPSELWSHLGTDFDAVCRKAMAKAPEDRYPSMKAFAAELMELQRSVKAADEGRLFFADGGADDVFDADTVIAPPERPAMEWKWVWVVLALVLAVGSVAAGFWLIGRQ